MGFIYKITNTKTNKCYIGETKMANVEDRWKGHRYTISKGVGCPALQNAVNKYGWDSFKFEVLIICFDEDRLIYEKEYIKKYNSMVPNGYNLTEGGQTSGNLGQKHTEETKRKISEWSKEYHKNPEVKKRKSEQMKAIMKETKKHINLGERMKKSEKWQKALAEKRIGSGACGTIRSEDTKTKISKSIKELYNKKDEESNLTFRQKHKQTMRKINGIKVSQFTKEDIFVKSYDSIVEASIDTNISRSGIQNNIKGRTKSAGGFIWKYADEKEFKEATSV